MRALILGGYGAVGARVADDLSSRGHSTVTAGRDAARADRVVDLRDGGLSAYRDALPGVDVVVNASGVENLGLVVLAAECGVAFVDVSATAGYLADVERLAPAVPVILSVGLAPGMTNLLAADLNDRDRGGIDIVVLLGVGDTSGAAATTWFCGLLGGRFDDPATGAAVRNFTAPRTFLLPGYGRRRLYRADFSDQHVLTRDLGVPVRTFFGLSSRVATAALAMLTLLPAAGRARLPTGLHLPGSEAWLVLATADGGGTCWATGRNQSHGTAAIATVAAQAAVGADPGVHHLHRIISLADIPGGAEILFGGGPACAGGDR